MPWRPSANVLNTRLVTRHSLGAGACFGACFGACLGAWLLWVALVASASGNALAQGTPASWPTAGPGACDTARGRRLNVGPGKTFAVPSAAAAVARDGDVIVISAGDYFGDVAAWPQNELTLCGAGGRARLFAAGHHAQGKGLWVVQGTNVVIEAIEFHGAAVPDQNGAGIRAEGRGLTVRDSGFFDNENGILGPTDGDLTIENSEFARNGRGDGRTHNVYVGPARRLSVRNSYFHEARIGHNLKSRAAETWVENSYFMDGPNGTASYQIETPNGGRVTLLGNLVQKGPMADNSTLISYGAEGLPAGRTHTLALVHNTLVSTYPGGAFLYASPDVAVLRLTANLLAGTNGPATFNADVADKVEQSHNRRALAGNFSAADTTAKPNFWPGADLAEELVLPQGVVPDASYANDAPKPFVRRRIGSGPRLIGALQSPP